MPKAEQVVLTKMCMVTDDIDEGEVFWLERSKLETRQLADVSAEMLPVFEQDNISELYFYHEDGQWNYRQL